MVQYNGGGGDGDGHGSWSIVQLQVMRQTGRHNPGYIITMVIYGHLGTIISGGYLCLGTTCHKTTPVGDGHTSAFV